MRTLRAVKAVGQALSVLLLLTACAGPAAPGGGADSQQAPSIGPKRVAAAIQGDPVALFPGLGLNPSFVRGDDALGDLIHVGASTPNNQAVYVPRLAEAVPSVENGLWRVMPDGKMETTWKLREGARWHDGTALTAADFVFSTVVAQDRELALSRNPAYERIEGIDSPDPRTMLVRWKQPYIDADRMFGSFALPLPSHKVKQAFEDSKATFLELPTWGAEFVGTGPFTVREWVRGSHVVLRANEAYVLGRPKLDEVEIKFITDDNTLVAHILAGSVEITLGRNISLEQAVIIRDQWRDGHVEVARANEIHIWPQFIGTNPPVVLDVRFRKALMHAIDRQELVDSIQSGLTTIAHSWIEGEPEYPELQHNIVRYDYDPRRAAQLIEGIGYTRGADGFFRDASGQRLSVEVRTTAEDDARRKTLLAVVDYWQKAGVQTDPNFIPPQLATDREYRATFPAFEMGRQGSDPNNFDALHSSQVRLPPRFTGGNYARYSNPEYDSLVERFLSTIPRRERMQIAGQIVRHMTDQLPVMGMYFSTEPTAIANRVLGVTARALGSTQAWNGHEWDLRN